MSIKRLAEIAVERRRKRTQPEPTICLPDTRCPSPLAAGRQDRCGLFAYPPRCTPESCSMRDAR